MPDTKPPRREEFDRKLHGVWGEFGGEGAYAVRYLQASVSIAETGKFTLVANIAGSEQWPVRELFQRDIDEKRVATELIPYLKNPQATKFFNPLTLALLPIEDGQPRRDLPKENLSKSRSGGFTYETASAPGYYRLTKCTSDLAYSSVEWRDECVKLVAIDGQHRLSALIRMKDELARDPRDVSLRSIHFANWRIPIVVVVPFPKSRASEPDILTSIRKLFVTINTSAQIPTRSRRILLTDDELVPACCQELLDWCHAGKPGAVPLELFDWRGHESTVGAAESVAAVVRVDELADLHSEYLIGEDEQDVRISAEQAVSLLLDSGLPRLKRLQSGKFWYTVREAYRKTVMPAVLSVFREFEPMAEYVGFLKGLEAGADDKTKHALSRLRVGKSYEDAIIKEQVTERYREIEATCAEKKQRIPELIRQDVGVRAVVFALGSLKRINDRAKKRTSAWGDFSKTFVAALNEVHRDNWFSKDKKYLRHAVVDPAGGVVNYRLETVEKGFGSLLALAIGSSMGMKTESGWAEEYLEILDATYSRGYAKEVRPAMEDKYPRASKNRLRELVRKEAARRAKAMLKSLRAELSLG